MIFRRRAVYVAGAQVERQLPHRTTLFAGFYTIHINHVIRARDINAPLPGSITALNPNGTRPLGNIGDIYQYESSGRFDQNQMFIGFNNRFNRTISFSANYSLSKTQNDTDGQGGGMFPVNSYDLTGEYGRAGFDVRHRFNFFGTINLPWQVSLNPFITATSGRPFNITTGQDTNLDRLFTERPSLAPDGVDCNNPPANIVCTQFGNFNLRPNPGETLIPRNFGEGPGYFAVNLRISKTWSFGSLPSSNAANQRGQQAGCGPVEGEEAPVAAAVCLVFRAAEDRAVADQEVAVEAVEGVVAAAVPSRWVRQEVPKRNATASSLFVSVSNLFNKVNLSNPVGQLSSPSFGESLALGSQFGGFGGGGGGGFGGGTGAGNRRVSAQVRFNF